MKTKDKVPGKCYYIDNAHGDNPRLGAKVLKDGKDSLFLDYYFGTNIGTDGKPKKLRKREKLDLYLWSKPRTPIQRSENGETIELAKKIRFEKAQQLLDKEKGYRIPKKVDVNFLDYFTKYEQEYTKKDIKMISMARRRFVDFLNDTPEYNIYAHSIKPTHINSDMMEAFVEYLQSRSKGEGAKSVFQRFKKVYRACAFENNLNADSPFRDAGGKTISIKIDRGIITKAVLSPDEIKQLIATTYPKQNIEVRDAFIFCILTGMRFCDVKTLTFEGIDISNKWLTYEQNKTKGRSSHSKVTLPLSDSLLSMIRARLEGKEKTDNVFSLPSHTMCLKALKTWTEKAGIDKHITWHCARHTFGTIMAANAPIRATQEMLGHSSLVHTQIYAHVANEQKKTAMNRFEELLN